MAISPTRNIVSVFDPITSSVYSVDTAKETSLGRVQISGRTTSLVVPTASPIGYAAVPTASVNGFSYLGAVQVLNLSAQGLSTSIALTNAQTVISNSTGSQLLVFNGTNSVTLLTPANALPIVDNSCYTGNLDPQNPVCTTIPGFDQPVFAIINGTVAYIFNCGAECGGVQASIQTLDSDHARRRNAAAGQRSDLWIPQWPDALRGREMGRRPDNSVPRLPVLPRLRRLTAGLSTSSI